MVERTPWPAQRALPVDVADHGIGGVVTPRPDIRGSVDTRGVRTRGM